MKQTKPFEDEDMVKVREKGRFRPISGVSTWLIHCFLSPGRPIRLPKLRSASRHMASTDRARISTSDTFTFGPFTPYRHAETLAHGRRPLTMFNIATRDDGYNNDQPPDLASSANNQTFLSSVTLETLSFYSMTPCSAHTRPVGAMENGLQVYWRRFCTQKHAAKWSGHSALGDKRART